MNAEQRAAALRLAEKLDGYWEMDREAAAMLRQLAAEPVAEPVAWGMAHKDGDILDVITPEEHAREEGGYTVPLYTHPPQNAALREAAQDVVRVCEQRLPLVGQATIIDELNALRAALGGDHE